MKRFIYKIEVFLLLVIFTFSFFSITYAQNNNLLSKLNKLNQNESDIKLESVLGSATTRSWTPTIDNLVDMRVYLKNMYTGKYLDVAGGKTANGTNVQQYKFNGTNSQKWGIYSHGNGEYSIVSYLGRTDGKFTKVLDVSNGLNEENTNVHLWEYNGSDAQKFSIAKTNHESYVLFTKVSNYEKCVQLDGFSCSNSKNVDQYSWVATANQCWLIEPINKTPAFGVAYAKSNYNRGVECYPDLRNWGMDCTNFA